MEWREGDNNPLIDEDDEMLIEAQQISVSFPMVQAAYLIEITKELVLIESEATCPQVISVGPSIPIPETLLWSADRLKLAWLARVPSWDDGQSTFLVRGEPVYPVVFNLQTGELRHHIQMAAALRGGLGWSADSTQIYLTPGEFIGDLFGGLYSYNLTTGLIAPVFTVKTSDRTVVFSGQMQVRKDGLILFPAFIGDQTYTGSSTVTTIDPINYLWAISAINPLTGAVEPLADLFFEPTPNERPGDYLQRYPPNPSSDELSTQTALSPDEQVMAVITNGYMGYWPDFQGLYIYPVGNGTPRTALEGASIAHPMWSTSGQYLSVVEDRFFAIYQRSTGIATQYDEALLRTQISSFLERYDASRHRIVGHPAVWLNDRELLIHVQEFDASQNILIFEEQLPLIFDITTGQFRSPAWRSLTVPLTEPVVTALPTPNALDDPSALPTYDFTNLYHWAVDTYSSRQTLEFRGIGANGLPASGSITIQRMLKNRDLVGNQPVNQAIMEYSVTNLPSSILIDGQGKRTGIWTEDSELTPVGYLIDEDAGQPAECDPNHNSAETWGMPTLETLIEESTVGGMVRIIPNDVIAGINSRHYHADNQSFGEFTSATIDIWITGEPAFAQSRYVSKIEIRGDGTFTQFGTGTMHLIFEMQSVNQTVTIEEPAICP